MAGTCCHNFALDRLSDKRKVSDNIKEFMAGRFVRVAQLGVIQYACMMFSDTGFIDHFCNAVNLLLFHVTFHDHNCIIQVSSFYKSHFEKRFQFMKEHKGAAFAYLCFKIINIIKYGILVTKHF